MKVIDTLKEMFSGPSSFYSNKDTGGPFKSVGLPATYYRTKSQDTGISESVAGGLATSSSSITSTLSNFLIGLTNFDELNERDIYEQLFIWEPEVAAVVNKVAEMVRSSYRYFMLIDDAQFDHIPKDLYNYISDESYSGELDPDLRALLGKHTLRNEMLDVANEIARNIDIPSTFETWASIMYLHGEVYLEKHDDLSLSLLPNNRITIIDDLTRIDANVNPNTIITDENYLVIDERLLNTQTIFEKGKFIHLKLSDVPLNIRDIKTRQTYGIYSISPIHRVIIPVWMKRQVYIIETLWRWANVPREHHIVNADAFNLALFPGTPIQKRKAADKAIKSFIAGYAKGLQTDAPDQKYVTSSNVTIQNLEHVGNAYMDASNLLNQINASVWDGLGMPPSVIRGLSDGSYASELIVASGASLRIEQIAKRISRVILDNMRERLLQINPEYPVNHLDIKIGFEVASSRLEQLKVAQLMKDIGIFTPTEIREESEHAPLTEQQVKDEGLVTAGNVSIVHSIDELSPEAQKKLETDAQKEIVSVKSNFGGVTGGRSDGKVNHPTTFKSASTQGTDSADAVSKGVLNQ
jgi:hypothetical protein